MPRCLLIAMLTLCLARGVPAALWEASAQIGSLGVHAELDDSQDPAVVMVRVENHSQVSAINISENFVQLLDSERRRLRPISPDDIVSEKLDRLRALLPQHVREMDLLLGEIRADYPQQKIVTAYGLLTQYLNQGLPLGWRTRLENWLLGTPASSPDAVPEAKRLVEEIGLLGRNYLWPRDVAPEAVYTGMVFFERPTQEPVRIFFQLNEDFVGLQMHLAASQPAAQP